MTTTNPNPVEPGRYQEVHMDHLPSSFRAGARVESRHFAGRLGTITRVIDADGELGGLVEVRWDGQRVSRSAGFFSPAEVAVVEETTPLLRHKTGLVWIG
jgi:hypothetical protein